MSGQGGQSGVCQFIPYDQPMAELTFWAKTIPDATGSPVPGASVRDHCLNVGAVAELITAALPKSVRALLPGGMVTLAALHDVGKISPGFQRKCGWWKTRFETLERAANWGQRESNHAAVSHAIIGHWLGKRHAGYAIAVGGHHGAFVHNTHEPPLGEGGRRLTPEVNDVAFAAHREALRQQVAEVFAHDLPATELLKTDEAFTVFLTGFITFADWLGSNEAFFPLDEATFARPLTLADAAAAARSRARKVMDWLGWGRTEVESPLTFKQLFPHLTEPRPVQRDLVALATRPGLFIVEAPMGGGKTEAALAAAYQRWTAPDGQRGLFFALPTQLTSERIFDRLETFLAQALATPGLAVLAHGSASLSERRVLEIRPASPGGDHAGGGRERPEESARDARLWFASGRQALLAPFGAGTLDQALLGVLPAKHCGLRLFGLAGKVVVLDEIHSYDRYTGTLAERLVADLLRLNATVIVLSATLTAERKRALLASAGVAPDALPPMSPQDAYPMITFAAREPGGAWVTEARPVEGEETPKTVTLEHRTGEEDAAVWEEACEAAERGACVLVIRNTVALAQATWRALRCARREDGPPVALLHSRFPRWRRDALEAHWITALGKQGPRPGGCLLVATQVVEQSVDIDADLLVTDLAPTDLLFQRIGRLHRHEFARPTGFERGRVILLHPRLDEAMGAKEMKAAFGPSGFVYPPYALWRAWQRWAGQPGVSIPRDIRPWLEATYAPGEPESQAVTALREEWNRESEKRTAVAGRRASRLVASDQKDEEGTLTRWNDQPSTELLLLQKAPERLAGKHAWEVVLLDGTTITIPVVGWSLPAAQAIHRNVVRVPRHAVRSWQAANPPWLHDYLDGGALGVVRNGEIAPVTDMEMPYSLAWNLDEGVRIEKSQPQTPEHFATDPEDGWW